MVCRAWRCKMTEEYQRWLRIDKREQNHRKEHRKEHRQNAMNCGKFAGTSALLLTGILCLDKGMILQYETVQQARAIDQELRQEIPLEEITGKTLSHIQERKLERDLIMNSQAYEKEIADYNQERAIFNLVYGLGSLTIFASLIHLGIRTSQTIKKYYP